MIQRVSLSHLSTFLNILHIYMKKMIIFSVLYIFLSDNMEMLVSYHPIRVLDWQVYTLDYDRHLPWHVLDKTCFLLSNTECLPQISLQIWLFTASFTRWNLLNIFNFLAITSILPWFNWKVQCRVCTRIPLPHHNAAKYSLFEYRSNVNTSTFIIRKQFNCFVPMIEIFRI